MAEFANHSIYITGGASGIGSAVAQAFAREGANITILDKSAKGLEEIKSLLGNQVQCIEGDVTVYEDHAKAVRKAVDAYGKLDVFIANAGVFDGFAKFENVTSEAMSDAYDILMNINVKGYFNGAKASLPELRKTAGNMIFTVSGAGFYPDGGGVWYTASKHAQIGLMKQLAFEVAPEIRVNAVAPGGTLTALNVIPPLKSFVKEIDNETKAKSIKRRNPLQIAMDSEDHVGPYLLLASKKSRAITGEVISSDGGLAVRGLG
ncbi:NAD(P)-dependent dehydrogenase (short-subunit alcohol dehydrogenase family) [Cytobacillus horneckiae]|uniref:3-(Cis-5,6-dihydroxycyclohexa-1, 3-dien-1-yl)propanoate dehydrogenase n=1 Tax=Cytobacillus horneckiae TaxID=549687 RepID=A0A2N0ZAR8_9BACI|nr:SDR family NAD(P)-dependent oxidoreductase [Cytobacillus horneckiae]MBN6887374.1 SDR family NAD(P)-dependent oxidoreductase [Cytobacillus horneckiae]MCM3178036.1 SDR family NAD(P)-dependent oxidoreductase [Cytobacillus horneckiae]MEC1157224.1 SDR family NAD(P)-dependent oxidoreductase [Cytobacillus horneckiae]MED2938157.1 SDR family NAD(P)-dependent oxidoreductase [Cytobacillus horneckiae]PKG26607.1 3-(cis-5,6-dihydroxycyclohexa-1,3-dien-1-yl)propanoate dehydrogenase [Cytobacillus horneckia